MTKAYFATLPTNEFLDQAYERIKEFNNYIENTGHRRKWQKSIDLYYGKHHGESGAGSGEILSQGSNGELSSIAVNKYRNNINHMLALTIAQKPSLDAKAKNTDLASLQQTRLARNILDSYMSDKRIGRQLSGAAQRALVMSKGFLYMTWNPSLGKPYTTSPIVDENNQLAIDENGQPKMKIIHEGDVEAEAKTPFDVMYDPRLKDWTKRKWDMVRSFESKWDLAARYPKYADKIISMSAEDALNERFNRVGASDYVTTDDDLIPVYEFYHLRTDSVPQGRYTKFLNDDVPLYDGPMPYPKLPVFRITPGEEFDSAEGYTDAYDMMALQDVLNILYSIPFTNQQATGIQFIHLPEGCTLNESMFKGLAVLRGGPPGTEPKALQLTSTAAEVFKNIDLISASQSSLMGLNDAVTGKIDPNLKSGIAIGRYQAMAIQYASGFQRAWAELNEDVGTFLFDLIKTFAKTERIGVMAGKFNKGAMFSFTGDQVSEIDRVEVNLGNPLDKTAAGRIEMADKFYEKGEITAKQYMQIASTGQLDSVFESEESEMELIRKENEDLMEGKPVSAIVGDLHLTHAKEHKTVINDPMLRSLVAQGDMQAMQIVESVLSHIQEHEQLYMGQTPFFQIMSGEPPPPPPPPMPVGPSGPIGPGAQPNESLPPSDGGLQMEGPPPPPDLPPEAMVG